MESLRAEEAALTAAIGEVRAVRQQADADRGDAEDALNSRTEKQTGLYIALSEARKDADTQATFADSCAEQAGKAEADAAAAQERIAALTERLVPFMTVGFLLLCGAVLILRRERLPDAVAAILREAFSPANAGAAAGGGVGGFLLTRAVRVGVMRGLVSNEAGCGTAPMAHAAADTDSPATQGVLGMLEVFVDTVLLCSITALTVLVGDTGYTAFGADGAACARAAFTSVLGDWVGGVFGISVFLFALASAFCWAHYGMTCVGYLRARRPGTGLCWRMLFTLAFCSALILGALMAPSLAWTLADAAIAAMTMLNLSCLLLGAREIATAR